jgi:hypothetical protein
LAGFLALLLEGPLLPPAMVLVRCGRENEH